LYLAGVFAGLALGTKYTSGVLLIAGLAGISWRSQAEGGMREALLRAGQFLLLAAAVSSPWWIKNFVATGNPIYPFLAPAGAMDRFRLDLYQGRPPWGGWMEAALLPLRATFSGIELAPGYSASIGPLLLGLGALAWMGWFSLPDERKQSIRNAAWIAIPGLVVWAVAGRVSEYLIQSRLYFSIFPAFAVLAGAGWKALESRQLPGIRLGRVAGALVLLVIWLEAAETGLSAVRQGADRELLGLRSREEYLSDNLGWYAPAVQSIRELPAGARVLMLWETRSLYCSPICVPDDLLDRWQHDVELYRQAGSILQSWRDQGYSHVLYNRRGADFYRYEVEQGNPSDWQALDALFAGLPLRSNFGDTYLLYELAQ
jgi:hypothetical protein